MNAKYIYSGGCRIGTVGQPTQLVERDGEPLFVGDIVITSTIDESGICDNTGLSVVCSDEWTSYSDGTHLVKHGDICHFVMGIKNVDFMGADSERWIVKKVKSFEDVVDGENWRDFKFSYKNT